MTTNESRRYQSIAEAGRDWGISPRTVRRRIEDGTLMAYRIGPKLIRLDAAEVAEAFRA